MSDDLGLLGEPIGKTIRSSRRFKYAGERKPLDTLPVVRLLQGDVREVLKTLPDESVHCCVTSPPYYALRSYGTSPQVWGGNPFCQHQWIFENREIDNNNGNGGTAAKVAFNQESRYSEVIIGFCRCGAWSGDLGLEPTPDLFIAHLVEVFREVRRALRNDGTFWLNIGDSYARAGGTDCKVSESAIVGSTRNTLKQMDDRTSRPPANLKNKDLIGIPWMLLAFALRADGWYLRSEIIWSKVNSMPESVTDRPTSSHETIFLFSKSEKYYYDNESVKEQAESAPSIRNKSAEGYGTAGTFSEGARVYGADGYRNLRNVWIMASQPLGEEHFAAYPSELPYRAILAGTSGHGCCSKCAAPWKRLVEKESIGHTKKSGIGVDSIKGRKGRAGETNNQHIGWQSTCVCNAEVVPSTVLDPFSGSGTTAMVAAQLQCNAIGIELNPKYIEMSRKRIAADVALLGKATVEVC